MRKFLTTLALLSLGTTALQAMPWPEEGSFDLGAGYRRDRLHWSVTHERKDDCTRLRDRKHETRSELKWHNVESYQIYGDAKYVNCYNIYFRGYGDFGWVTDGKQVDSDFARSPNCVKSVEFSRSHAKVNGGHVYDLSGGIGYYFRFFCNRVTLAPIVGYSYHFQHYNMRHLEIDIDLIDGLLGKVDGLNSHFRSRFKGWWAGMDVNYWLLSDLLLFGSGEYHWGHYRGKGNWNLRTDFVKDFRQHSDCFGQVYSLGCRWQFLRHWNTSVVGYYYSFRTSNGTDHVFLASGKVESRLNAVHWHSFNINWTVGYDF